MHSAAFCRAVRSTRFSTRGTPCTIASVLPRRPHVRSPRVDVDPSCRLRQAPAAVPSSPRCQTPQRPPRPPATPPTPTRAASRLNRCTTLSYSTCSTRHSNSRVAPRWYKCSLWQLLVGGMRKRDETVRWGGKGGLCTIFAILRAHCGSVRCTWLGVWGQQVLSESSRAVGRWVPGRYAATC